MKTRSIPLDVFTVQAMCDGCGGVMRTSGVAFMSSPPQYPHECIDCGHRETLKRHYPYTDYRAKNK